MEKVNDTYHGDGTMTSGCFPTHKKLQNIVSDKVNLLVPKALVDGIHW